MKRVLLSFLMFFASSVFLLEAACNFNGSVGSPQLEAGSGSPDVGDPLSMIAQVNINADANDQVIWNWQKNTPSAPGTFTDILPNGQNGITVTTGGLVTITARYQVPSVNTRDTADYRVRITLTCGGGATSVSTTTRINVRPKINVQPQNFFAARTTNPTMSVTALGQDVGYQWYYYNPITGYIAISNGVNPGLGSFSGVLTPTLTFSGFQISQARDTYFVRVRNTYWTDPAIEVDSSWATAVMNSEPASWATDGICANGTNGTAPSRGDLSLYQGASSVFVNGTFGFDWNNYQSGLGSCSITTVNSNDVARCTDPGRFDEQGFYFRSNVANISTSILTQYRYEKQNGPSWAPVDGYSGVFSNSGSSQGPEFRVYPAQILDSGNYRLQVSSRPCSGATTFAEQAFSVQSSPVTLGALTYNGYSTSPQAPYIGDSNYFYVSLDTGIPQDPYQWVLQKFDGTNWVDSVVDTSHTQSTSVYFRPYQDVPGVTGLRKPQDSGLYRVKFTDSTTPTAYVAYSSEVQLNVTQQSQTMDPIIPSPVVVYDGNSAWLTAMTFGGDAPHHYLWEMRASAGSGWVAIPGCSINSSTCETPVLRRVIDDERQFQVRVYTESLADVRVSMPASIEIRVSSPVITGEPIGGTITAGNNFTFQVTATGTPVLQYQWRKNGSNIAGATSSTYTVSNAQTSDTGTYSVLVSHSASAVTRSSQNVLLTVNAGGGGPSITTHPQGQTLAQGSNAVFSVTVSPASGPTFQWMQETSDGSGSYNNIVGATNSTLTLNNITSTHQRSYKVRVTHNSQSVDSDTARLVVAPPIVINPHPVGSTIASGGSTTLSVSATGLGLTYQWLKRNGGSDVNVSDQAGRFSGSNSSTLTILNSVVADTGDYRVRVTDSSSGSQLSNYATVNVIQRVSISSHPANQGPVAGVDAIFSVTAAGGGTLAYDWRKDGISISPNPSKYSGLGTNTLRVLTTTTNDNGQYSVAVSNTVSSESSNPGVLLVVPQISITSQPQSASIQAGQGVTFNIAATGPSPLTYQWRKNGTNISGAVLPFFQIVSAATTDSGSYDVVISHAASSQTRTSTAAVLNVTASPPGPNITQHPTDILATVGLPSPAFSVATNPAGEHTYQWQRENPVNSGSYEAIVGANASTYSISVVSANDARRYRAVVTRNGQSVNTSSANLSLTTPLAITSEPTDLTVLRNSTNSFAVTATGSQLSYQWFVRVGGSESLVVDVANRFSGATTRQLFISNIQLADAGEYRVRVTDGSGNFDHSRYALLNVIDPVQITSQPSNLQVTSPNTAVFSVAASGTGPLTYQWRKNGTAISANPAKYSGLGTSTLQILNTDNTDEGVYSVVVSNSLSNQTSEGRALDVRYSPAITTQPQDSSGIAGASVSLTVVATGDPSPTYQWFKGATSLNDVAGRISGSQSSTLLLQNLQAADAGLYFVRVSNVVSNLNSRNTTVGVIEPARIVTHPTSQNSVAGSLVSFSVVAAGTPTLNYQWYRDNLGSPISNGGKFSGATTATLSISNVQSTEEANYFVRVSNVGGSADSAQATLVLDAGSCPTPNMPSPQSPAMNASTNGSPQFIWSPVSYNSPGCSLNYDLTISPDNSCTSANAQRFNFSPATSSFNFPGSLLAGSTYYWCVRSSVTGGVVSNWTSPRAFLVQSGEIPTPTIQVQPSGTSVLFPSGQTEILISLSNGEPGSSASLYEVNGTERTLIGQRSYTANGTADFPISLSDHSMVRRFDYQARTQRGDLYGAYSLTASYYFDPTLILGPASQLTDAQDEDFILSSNQMRFTRVENATGYEIYRRVGLNETCDSQVDTCFQNITPFKRILRFEDDGNLPASVVNSINHTLIFTDSQLSSLAPQPANSGVSYFVVAYSENSRSARSNSVSSVDNSNVVIIRDGQGRPVSPTIDIRTLADGRTIQIWASNLNGYGLDNSADLISEIWVAPVGTVQPGQDPLQTLDFVDLIGFNHFSRPVDTLRRSTIDGGVQNAILLSEHQGNPGILYGHLVCLKDVSGNMDFNTRTSCFAPRLSPPLIDETAPEFDGIGRVTALADGRSLDVEFPRAIGFEPDDPSSSIGSEILQYEVYYTSDFSRRGIPNFENANVLIIDQEDLEFDANDRTHVQLIGLQTGTKYAVYVQVLDQAGNRVGSSIVTTGETLNNRPYPASVEFGIGAQPGEILLDVLIADRNLELTGDEVHISDFQIGSSARAMSAVDRLSSRVRGSTLRALAVVGGGTQRITVRMDLADVLRMENLAGFYYSLEVTDREGNSGRLEGHGQLVKGLQAGASGFVGASAGCGRASSPVNSHEGVLFFLSVVSLSLMLLFRRRRLA